MANATGRPISPLHLIPDERAYLERQVRRHRVARSLSERCRIILRCADGVSSKSVAAELDVHEHTVGKWRRRFLKDRIEGLRVTRIVHAHEDIPSAVRCRSGGRNPVHRDRG